MPGEMSPVRGLEVRQDHRIGGGGRDWLGNDLCEKLIRVVPGRDQFALALSHPVLQFCNLKARINHRALAPPTFFRLSATSTEIAGGSWRDWVTLGEGHTLDPLAVEESNVDRVEFVLRGEKVFRRSSPTGSEGVELLELTQLHRALGEEQGAFRH